MLKGGIEVIIKKKMVRPKKMHAKVSLMTWDKVLEKCAGNPDKLLRLASAALKYELYEKEPDWEMTADEELLWALIAKDIDGYNEAFDKRSEKRAEAGRIGGMVKNHGIDWMSDEEKRAWRDRADGEEKERREKLYEEDRLLQKAMRKAARDDWRDAMTDYVYTDDMRRKDEEQLRKLEEEKEEYLKKQKDEWIRSLLTDEERAAWEETCRRLKENFEV